MDLPQRKTLAEALQELKEDGFDPAEARELELDGTKVTSFQPLAEWTGVAHLSLRVCGIRSLEGFPKLPNLQVLYLADNNIPGGLEHLEGLPLLGFIDLTNNKLPDVEQLAPLANCKELNDVRVDSNPFVLALGANYRDEVRRVLPQVQHVDPEEDEDDDEEDDEEEEEEEEDERPAKRPRTAEDDEEEDDEEGEEDYDNGPGIGALVGPPLEDDSDDYEGEEGAEEDEEDDLEEEEGEDDE